MPPARLAGTPCSQSPASGDLYEEKSRQAAIWFRCLDRSSPREPHLSDLQGSSILERLVEAEVEAVLSLFAYAVVEAEVRARLSHDEQPQPARHRRIPVPEARVVPQDSTHVRITHGVDVYPGDCAQPLPDGESELRFTVEERFPDVAEKVG